MFLYSNRQEDNQAKAVKIVKRLVKKGELLKEDAETTYPSEWALYRDRYIVGPQGGRALGGNMMGTQKGGEPSFQNLKEALLQECGSPQWKGNFLNTRREKQSVLEAT